jgi:hypothetical protein
MCLNITMSSTSARCLSLTIYFIMQNDDINVSGLLYMLITVSPANICMELGLEVVVLYRCIDK